MAANESLDGFPGFTLTLPTMPSPITAINANGEPDVANGTQYTIVSVNDNPATPTVDESLGCNVSDYPTPPNATSMAVTVRGVCARVGKAIRSQQAGYAAAAMVNNSTALPPFEGPIFSHPDTGEQFTVTIPFIGVRGLATTPTSDGARLRAASGSLTTVNNTTVANANFTGLASFTSGGPRNGDSFLKPNITAPGVSIFSTENGSGNNPGGSSGTSMASPHVAGVAALARQAHPTWSGNELAAAIVNTGRPSPDRRHDSVPDEPCGNGSRVPVRSRAHAGRRVRGPADPGRELRLLRERGRLQRDSDDPRLEQGRGADDLRRRNLERERLAAHAHPERGDGHGRTRHVRCGRRDARRPDGHGRRAPRRSARSSGLVTFTPQGGANNNITLRVPYYLVPRPSSLVDISVADSTPDSPSFETTATVTNDADAAVAGTADFYAWGLRDGEDADGSPADMRAIGVQSFDIGGGDRLIGFGVSTWHRWSNASTTEFDIFVDVDPQNGNGDDYIVVAADVGAITAGVFNGQFGSFVFSTRSAGASGFVGDCAD